MFETKNICFSLGNNFFITSQLNFNHLIKSKHFQIELNLDKQKPSKKPAISFSLMKVFFTKPSFRLIQVQERFFVTRRFRQKDSSTKMKHRIINSICKILLTVTYRGTNNQQFSQVFER